MRSIAAFSALGLALAGALLGCDDGAGAATGVNPAPAGKPWKTLDEWRLFADAAHQIPAEGVVPFEVTSPLFSDYTAKHRFLWIPEGEHIGYKDDGVWDLPVGAILVKTFAYPIDERDPAKGERILETRLLVHEPSGWVPHTYVWDEAQTTAERKVAGTYLETSWIDATGATRAHRYVVPTTNECQECHGKMPASLPLGLKTAQLDRPTRAGDDNQIDHLASLGWFATAPPPADARTRFAAPDSDADLALRARSYLDANCAHCHSPTGDASNKALYLDFASTGPSDSPTNWGVCKVPTSAGGATCGYTYDVVPGDAAHSIMICRMESTRGADQMPPIGRGLVHAEGVALVRAWIDAMEPTTCGAQ